MAMQANLFEANIGNKVFIRRKSNKNYIIVGVLKDVTDNHIVVISDKDSFIISYEDIYSADLKSKF